MTWIQSMDRGGHRHQQHQQGLGRGQGRGRGRGRGAPVRGRGVRVRCSNEIRATVIDHVVNHDLSMREAGQGVQPKLEPSYCGINCSYVPQ